METIDGLDRQIKPGMTATELLSVEMGRIHPLTGPVYVEGAQPGDLLAIKIEAVNTASRGFTRAQAYCLTSVAVDLKVSQVVDVPNLIVSAFLPLDIFVG